MTRARRASWSGVRLVVRETLGLDAWTDAATLQEHAPSMMMSNSSA